MQKYLKKTNWGEYWACDSSLNNKKIINLSLNMISKIGTSVFDLNEIEDQSKITDLIFFELPSAAKPQTTNNKKPNDK